MLRVASTLAFAKSTRRSLVPFAGLYFLLLVGNASIHTGNPYALAFGSEGDASVSYHIERLSRVAGTVSGHPFAYFLPISCERAPFALFNSCNTHASQFVFPSEAKGLREIGLFQTSATPPHESTNLDTAVSRLFPTF